MFKIFCSHLSFLGLFDVVGLRHFTGPWLVVDVGLTVATVSTATVDLTVRRPTTATVLRVVTAAPASLWKQATRATATSSSRVPTADTKRRATDTASGATTTGSAGDGRASSRRWTRPGTRRPRLPATSAASSTANVSRATPALAARISTRVPVEMLASTVERVRSNS